MQYTKPFDELRSKNTDIAGGKGASLGEMTRAKIPVPPGFVVLADAFRTFIIESGIDTQINSELAKIKVHDTKNVSQASYKIRSLIHKAPMPKEIAEEISDQFKKLKFSFVAVRSSATAEDSSQASWAGELESYLNTDSKNLLSNVKKCWSSLFTPRAIFYRFEKKLHTHDIAVAVVIQAMVQSDISGIAFTVHPVTNDYNQMVIEAGYGLGEAIVGGKITPDTYIINKKNVGIDDKNISQQVMMIVRGAQGVIEKKVPKGIQNKQKLSDAHILKLAIICKAIEKHYKKPQDIEWACENGKIYITQSRPITTLK